MKATLLVLPILAAISFPTANVAEASSRTDECASFGLTLEGAKTSFNDSYCQAGNHKIYDCDQIVSGDWICSTGIVYGNPEWTWETFDEVVNDTADDIEDYYRHPLLKFLTPNFDGTADDIEDYYRK